MPTTYRDDATFSPTKQGEEIDHETHERHEKGEKSDPDPFTLPDSFYSSLLFVSFVCFVVETLSSRQLDLGGGDDEVIDAGRRGGQLVRLDAPAVVLEDALERRR